jgi:DNA-binding transcriptional LysR family regulator
MDRLEAMTVLLAAADTGSLSAASRRLRIPLATISRRVSELEKHLNARLVLRGRKLTLTDAGRAYVDACRRIMEDVAEAERTAAGEYSAPQGELILSAPPVIGRSHAMPIVVEFLRAYPDVRVRVQLSERIVNLLEEQIDLAMRVGELPDSSMIAKRIGFVRQVLCASPGYLKARGVPKKPADLVSHDCVAYESYAAGGSWKFSAKGGTESVQIPFRLVVNSGEAAVVAATVADDSIALIGLVVGLGLTGTGIAYVLYYSIVQRMGAVQASSVTYLPPLVALLIGSVLVGERLRATDLFAMGAILSGVHAIQTSGSARARAPIEPAAQRRTIR